MAKARRGFRTAPSKIVSWREAARVIEEAEAFGKAVVFTNGCFDILHIGHIRYLQEARALGDMLIVGVNTDNSVKRLKGPGRPVNQENERVEVLAALECVDYVTLFDEDTPIEVIQSIKPHIQAKGGDYKPENMPEAKVLESYGGRIEIIPFHQTDSSGKSTTSLIDKILKG